MLIEQEQFFRELALKKNTRFLDAACGHGDYALAAAAHIGDEGQIFAFDQWTAGIAELANTIAAERISNIVPRVAEICTLPLANRSIDICLLATVLYDLVQDGSAQAALQEIRRVLKLNGVLAVVEFKKIPGLPGSPVETRLTPKEVEELVQIRAFTINKKVEIGPHHNLTIFQ